MNILKILTFVIFASCLLYCSKNGTGPDESTEPDGYQKDIAWQTLADSPWPMFQCDPQGTGRSRFLGPQKGVITDWFNTICKGGSKFTFTTIDHQEYVYLSIGNVWSDSLSETDGFLFKFDKNGKSIWHVNLHGYDIYNSPLIDNDGFIYIGSTDGHFYAINSDGTIKWKFNTNSQITCGFGGATIGIDGTLYFSSIENLYAISREGNIVWSLPGYGDTRVVISPDGNTLYVNKKSEGFDALDQNGNLKWRYKYSEKGNAFNPLVEANGRIYLPLNDSTFSALNENGDLIWEFCIDSYINRKGDQIDFLTSPTLDNIGNLYFVTTDDLYSVDYSGKLRWIIRGLGGAGAHLICDKDGNVYLISERFNNRNVFSISRSGFLNWKLTLPGSEYIFCAPSISSDGKIYLITLANSESKLYIIQ